MCPEWKKNGFILLFFFFSWNICLMCLLPASSSCGFDVSKWCSSCLLPGNRREKIDVVMSEGEPEGDRRRGKRGEESWRVRRWLLFSPFQAFVDRSTSLPEHLKKKVMWCAAERWMITSVVKTFHTNVLKSLLTPLETFFFKIMCETSVHPRATPVHFVYLC